MEKVIIIGAGPAGLTAAIELLKNGGDYDRDHTRRLAGNGRNITDSEI